MKRTLLGTIVSMIAIGIGCGAYGASDAGQLYAGTAKVDISPENTVEDHGQIFCLPEVPPDPPVPPDNIHDPLYARVVVLKNSTVSVAIVTLDLPEFSSKWVIDKAKSLYGIDHVVLCASHTHSGMWPRGMVVDTSWTRNMQDPGVSLNWPGFSADPWYAATEQKVLATIGQANANLFPARIAAGKGAYESVYLGHNRRFVRPGGGVTMMWDNPKRIPTKPADPTVRVIRIEDEAGKPRVLMVHYACHPVILMGAGVISRDFPGAMVDYVEQQLGESCMAMFLQGASGDIDPYEISLRGEYGFNMIRQSGISLGKAALRVADDMASPEAAETSMRVKESMLKISYRRGNGKTDACIMTVVINDDLAMVSMPGEVFCQHQLNLAAESPIASTFILGLSYSGRGSPYMLYIPTAQAVQQGGYGATTASFVAADAGERMVNAAVAAIKELKNR